MVIVGHVLYSVHGAKVFTFIISFYSYPAFQGIERNLGLKV